MALSNPAAGFIGASVTLVLVIIFMILVVILVRQCLAFISKRNAIRNQMEQQRHVREQIRQRRGSVSEPIPATFDWHHTIRIEGSPPPSYKEAKTLPPLDGGVEVGGEVDKEPYSSNQRAESGTNGSREDSNGQKISKQTNGVHPSLLPKASQEGSGVNGALLADMTNSTREVSRNFSTDYTEYHSTPVSPT